MKDLRKYTLPVAAATVVGAFGFGLGYLVNPSPEPEVDTVYKTKTVTETETVEVPAELPAECAAITAKMNKASKQMLEIRHKSAIVSVLAQNLRGAASANDIVEYNKDFQIYVDQQDKIGNAGIQYLRVVQKIETADSECQEAIESGS